MASLRSPGVEGATGPFILRRKDGAMFEDPRSTGRTLTDSDGDRPCIRLQVDHHACLRAEELLTAMGGRRCLPAMGAVYMFLLSEARDEAMDQVRIAMCWTVS